MAGPQPTENLALLRDMRAGRFGDGEKVLRARIDMTHPNMLMRDPVMYRIRHARHFRAGDAWCIYPTYDWAHGQSDAIEGVTHSLCTLEFEGNRQLVRLVPGSSSAAGRPAPPDRVRPAEPHPHRHVQAGARRPHRRRPRGRLGRPALPTLRGLRRRGYPPEAIRAFCAHIGVARVNGTLEIELLESFVRAHHNRFAQRRMAVLRPLEVVIDNWPAGHTEYRPAVNNPENPADGTRQVPFSGRLWIERDDFMIDPPRKFYRLAPGREVRLRAGYFLRCDDVETGGGGEVVRLRCSYDPATGGGQAPDGRKVRATLHWVSAEHAVEAGVALYDRLFSDPVPGADGRDPLESYNPASRELIGAAKLEPALAGTPRARWCSSSGSAYFARDGDPGLAAAVPPHRRPARRMGQHPEAPRQIGGRDMDSLRSHRLGRRAELWACSSRSGPTAGRSRRTSSTTSTRARSSSRSQRGGPRPPTCGETRAAGAARLRCRLLLVRVLRRDRPSCCRRRATPTTPPVTPWCGTTSA